MQKVAFFMPKEFSPDVDVNDFLSEYAPEYDWCIPGKMERRDRLIVTGNEGKGKSTLLRQIAVKAAMGLDPFTSEDITPQKVWFVDLENPRGHLRREVNKVKRGLPIAVGMLTVSSWPEGLDLMNADDLTTFISRLKDIKPDLLIIGPMYKMMLSVETEEKAGYLARQMDIWRKEVGCALILETHQPHQVINNNGKFRPERPIGSSVWLRWPEFGICLEDDGTWRVVALGGRRECRQVLSLW
jgi:replicative DNA helicase